MSAGRRVVVTGLGAVTPLGLTADETFENALKGVSGIAPISLFDASQFDVRFAGEVKNFNTDVYINKKDQKRMDRFLHFSAAAAKMAIQDCGLTWTDELRDKTGVFVGCGI